jgi:drug/metabolite transporter (DMT)-like permease
MTIEWITPEFCYSAAIFGAFITGVSQMLLKTQANKAKKKGFLRKFLNVRVICSYALLMLTLAINQLALIYVPVSVLPCITATSFIWIFLMGRFVLKEKVSKRKVIGIGIILVGIFISRL